MAKNGTTVRDARGRFVTGSAPGPGRPRGSRVKLTEAFLSDLQTAWEEHGPSVLKRVIEEHPERFLSAVSAIIPKDYRFEMTNREEMRLVVQLDSGSRLAQRLIESGGVQVIEVDD